MKRVPGWSGFTLRYHKHNKHKQKEREKEQTIRKVPSYIKYMKKN